MNEEKVMTENQWNKEGYVLNADAKGTSKYLYPYNKWYTVFGIDQVHLDEDQAKANIKKKRHDAYMRSKAQKEKLEKFWAWRESYCTEYQWLQRGRIPNSNAKWFLGSDMNRKYRIDECGKFGDEYQYSHIDDTHLPVDETELQNALSDCNSRYEEQLQKKMEEWKRNHPE